MLFDLQSGRRRRVVQVVFGGLALLFAVGFIGFNIGGEGGGGGIVDEVLGGGSGSGEQFDQQIEDAQAAIEANPNNGNAYADLIAAYFGSASTGISRDSQTGQVSISTEARSDLQQAGQAWDDYMATKPERVSVSAAASAVQAFVLLDDAAGASEAQAVVADEQGSVSAYAQLALYLYADGQIEQGDKAGAQAVAAAEPSQRKQVQKTVDGYREQAIKFQEQLEEQQQQEGGSDAGQQQLEDPFGNLGGGTAPVAPAP